MWPGVFYAVAWDVAWGVLRRGLGVAWGVLRPGLGCGLGCFTPWSGCGLGVSHRCCSLVCATILLQRHAQSGLNPALIVKSDLTKLSPISIINKYADEIHILVAQYCDVDLTAEFENILCWAASKLRR